MALTPEEQAELDSLEKEVGGAIPQKGLTPDEAKELAQLEAEVGQQSSQPSRSGEAFLEGAGQSLTMGYLPQLQAAVEPYTAKIYDAFTGEDISSQVNPDYLKRRDEYIRRSQGLQKEAPVAFGAGQLAGAIPSATTMAGGGAATIGGRLAQAAGIGAIEGAAYNPGDVEGQYSGAQIGERAKQGLAGAVTGAAGQAIGSVAGKAFQKTQELPGKLKNFAELKAFKQSGAMLRDFRKNLGNNKANEIGRELLDKNIVASGDTFEDIFQKSSQVKEEAGRELGDIYRNTISRAEKSIKENPSFSQRVFKIADFDKSAINAEKIADDIRVKAGTDLMGKPTSKKVLASLSEELDTLAENGPNLDLDKAVQLKVAFDDMINYNKEIRDNTLLQRQYKNIRDSLNNAIDKRIDTLGKISDDPNLVGRLKKAKKTYGNMSEVVSISKDRIARENANRFFSLGDRISGASGAALGAIQSGDIEGALKGGLIGLIAGKASRLAGNSVSARAIDRAAKILENNPVVLGSYAQPLVEAAIKSPKAFADVVEKFRRDPQFIEATKEGE